MHHDNHRPRVDKEASLRITSSTAINASRSSKRRRTSPPPTDMDITPDRAASDASSDWDDWADAMVAQGEPSSDAAGAASEGVDGDGDDLVRTREEREEEAWVLSMVEQGTERSVVQAAESSAWDYALQMAVEAEVNAERGLEGEWVRATMNYCMHECTSYKQLEECTLGRALAWNGYCCVTYKYNSSICEGNSDRLARRRLRLGQGWPLMPPRTSILPLLRDCRTNLLSVCLRAINRRCFLLHSMSGT